MRLLLLSLFFFSISLSAQDTFSIVAVDPTTGEVGGAGATCLDTQSEGVSAIIISDVLPGKGAIHTQSFWNGSNQVRARNKMLEGLSPEEIVDDLIANDVQFNPSIRQYGIADLDDNNTPRAAAFTGANCFDAKDHRIGENYAIQGNILLDTWILDSMETRFLNTEGSLAEKLMAALQGANVAGADSRCLNEGVSSRSAFIRVAKPEDEEGSFYLDLEVPFTPFGQEPIDALQQQFDTWLLTNRSDLEVIPNTFQVFPNPASTIIRIQSPVSSAFQLKVYTIHAQICFEKQFDSQSIQLDVSEWCGLGTYILQFQNLKGELLQSHKIIVN